MKNRLLLVVATLLGLTTAAIGQATNGTIAGSVVDPAQAAIVGATVTATSLETNDSRMATTNKVGGYRIESVPPGTYRIDVTAPSFAKTTVDKTVVDASVVTSVNVTMSLGIDHDHGGSEMPIEVEALKTDSGELSDTLSRLR